MASPFVLLCPILGFGLFLVLLFRMVSAVRGRSTTRFTSTRPSPRLRTTMADDGFWVDSGTLDTSEMIQYIYWVGELQKSGTVPVEPGPDGRQFVYTGAKPDRITVTLEDAAPEEEIRESTVTPIIPPVITTRPMSKPTRHHFPSAY